MIQDKAQRRARNEADAAADELLYGHKGKNGNWPGCTVEFVKRVEKDRAAAKRARKARKKSRK